MDANNQNMHQQGILIASEAHVCWIHEEHGLWTEGSYSSLVCLNEALPRTAWGVVTGTTELCLFIVTADGQWATTRDCSGWSLGRSFCCKCSTGASYFVTSNTGCLKDMTGQSWSASSDNPALSRVLSKISPRSPSKPTLVFVQFWDSNLTE